MIQLFSFKVFFVGKNLKKYQKNSLINVCNKMPVGHESTRWQSKIDFSTIYILFLIIKVLTWLRSHIFT